MKPERSGPRQYFRFFLIDRLLRGLKPSSRILDAGCGDGKLSLRLSRRRFRVTAVDINRDALLLLSKKLTPAPRHQGLSLICSALETMPFRESSFEAIVCSEVLEHIENDTDLIRSFCQALVKGGVLIMSVPLQAKGWDVWDTLCGHKRLYSLGPLESMLHDAGFRIEKRFFWGYPFLKLYHKYVFLPWAKKAKTEEEINQERLVATKIGKSRLVSVVLGALFLLDIFCTPPPNASGLLLRARKL